VSFAKAGASYDLDSLVASMSKDGWLGNPIDVVAMPDGTLASTDNTRVVLSTVQIALLRIERCDFLRLRRSTKAGETASGSSVRIKSDVWRDRQAFFDNSRSEWPSVMRTDV